MRYAIQLDPTVPQAWQFMVSWPGYWTGLGFVEKPQDALPFYRKRDAVQAMLGTFLGMNGCMKVVPIK
jgi:hypothetical protein